MCRVRITLPKADKWQLSGASSNHAFFWSLSSSLEELGKRKPERRNLPPRQVGASEGPRRLPLPPLKPGAAEQKAIPQQDTFPGRSTAIQWANLFFDTVGVVLPFANKSLVLREIELIDSRTGTWESCPANTQALLNIIFAYALATLEDGAAEPFYRRALSQLDEKGLYLPTIEACMSSPFRAAFSRPVVGFINTEIKQCKRSCSWEAINKTASEHRRALLPILGLSKLPINLAFTLPLRTTDITAKTRN